MFEIKKRGKGKVVKCLALRAMYNSYKANSKPKDKIVDYKTYVKIIKACNRETVKAITEESETVKLPYRLGSLKVTKYERGFDKPKHKWAVDFNKSRQLGFTVYHDQKYIYAWTWNKKISNVKNKGKYKFVAARDTKRAVPRMLKTTKIDYYG